MELKRIFSSKKIWVMVILLLVFHTVWFAKLQYDANGQSFFQEEKRVQKELLTQFDGMQPKEICKKLERQMACLSILWQIAEYETQEDDEAYDREERLAYEKRYARVYKVYQAAPKRYTQEYCERQYVARQQLYERYAHMEAFQKQLKEIQENAEQMGEISIFQNSSTQANPNIQKTSQDYARLADVELTLGNDHFLVSLFQGNTVHIALLLFAIVLELSMLSERKKGLWSVVYAAPGGRGKLAIHRIGTLAVSIAGFELMLFGGMGLISVFFYGWENNFGRMVQSIPQFSDWTYPMTESAFFALYLGITFAVALAQALLSWVVLSGLNQSVIGLFFDSISYVAGFLIYHGVEAQSPLAVLKYVNLYAGLNLSEWMVQYRNFIFGPKAFGRLDCFLVLAGILVFVCGILSVWIAIHKRPTQRNSCLLRKMEKLTDGCRSITEHLGMTGMEWYKSLFLEKNGIVFIVLCFWCMSQVQPVSVWTSPQEAYCTAFYKQHSGVLTKETKQELIKEETQAEKIRQEYLKAERAYAKGKIDSDRMEEAYHRYESSQGQRKGTKILLAQIEDLQKTQERQGKGLWLMDTRGYQQLLGEASYDRQVKNGLLVLAAVFFMSASLLAFERKRGTREMLCAMTLGRNSLVRKKAGVIVFSSVFATLVVYGIDSYQIFCVAPFGNFRAPIASISFLRDVPWNGSIGGYLVFLFVLRTISGVCVGLFAGAMSAFWRTEICMAVGAVLLIPSALDALGWQRLSFLSLARMQAVQTWLSDGGMGLLSFYILEMILWSGGSLFAMFLYWCKGSADIRPMRGKNGGGIKNAN